MPSLKYFLTRAIWASSTASPSPSAVVSGHCIEYLPPTSFPGGQPPLARMA